MKRFFWLPLVLGFVKIAMNQPIMPGLEVPKPNLADDRVRFQVELEFVQCLANPHYLNFLAQKGYFKVFLKSLLQMPRNVKTKFFDFISICCVSYCSLKAILYTKKTIVSSFRSLTSWTTSSTFSIGRSQNMWSTSTTRIACPCWSCCKMSNLELN